MVCYFKKVSRLEGLERAHAQIWNVHPGVVVDRWSKPCFPDLAPCDFTQFGDKILKCVGNWGGLSGQPSRIVSEPLLNSP